MIMIMIMTMVNYFENNKTAITSKNKQHKARTHKNTKQKASTTRNVITSKKHNENKTIQTSTKTQEQSKHTLKTHTQL